VPGNLASLSVISGSEIPADREDSRSAVTKRRDGYRGDLPVRVISQSVGSITRPISRILATVQPSTGSFGSWALTARPRFVARLLSAASSTVADRRFSPGAQCADYTSRGEIEYSLLARSATSARHTLPRAERCLRAPVPTPRLLTMG
jgi:hypothetical protein